MSGSTTKIVGILILVLVLVGSGGYFVWLTLFENQTA